MRGSNTFGVTTGGALNLPGIGSSGVYFGQVFVQSNYFGPAVTATSAIGTGQIGTALFAASSLKAPTFSTYYESNAQLRVSLNTFDRVWRGVQVTNFSNSSFTGYVNNNTFSLVSDVNTSNVQRAIEFNSNLAGVVNTNTITGFNTTNTLVTGVYFTSNNNSSSQCNITNTIGIGFQHDGANLGTIWRYNTMQTNGRGMSLTNGGIIGPQGTTSLPSDNKWLGTWTGTLNGTYTDQFSIAYSNTASITSPSYSVLWVRTSPSTNYPPNNSGFNTATSYLVSGALQNASNTAQSFDCASGTYGGGGGNPGGGGGRLMSVNGVPGPDFELMENVATDNLIYFGAANETGEINKNQLFNLIDANPDYKDSSLVLQQFYDNEAINSRGTLSSIEDQLASGNIGVAAAGLSGFTPQTGIEDNYKSFLQIAANYMRDTLLTTTDSTLLYEIAHKCPFIDGAIVHKARILYGNIYKLVKVYNDAACLESGISTGRVNKNNLSNQSMPRKILWNEKTVKVYPNPAIDEITISSQKENEFVTVKISDVTGKVLYDQKVKIKAYSYQMKLELKNGVYLVTLVNEDAVTSHTKLVISK